MWERPPLPPADAIAAPGGSLLSCPRSVQRKGLPCHRHPAAFLLLLCIHILLRVDGQQPLGRWPCPCPAGEHLRGTAVRTLLFLQDKSRRCQARWLGAGTSSTGSTRQSHRRPPPATSLAPARAGALWRCRSFGLGSGRSPTVRAVRRCGGTQLLAHLALAAAK